MNSPYCVQRLELPSEPETSFEAGFGLGGSNESRKLIKTFCKHDYMGSSEFEWGALPKAYEEMGKNIQINNYQGFILYLDKHVIYGFGPKTDIVEIEKWISEEATNHHHLKESSYFRYALGLDKNFSSLGQRIKGWLDIENHFMFFIDKNMFDKFMKFYGIGITTEKI